MLVFDVFMYLGFIIQPPTLPKTLNIRVAKTTPA